MHIKYLCSTCHNQQQNIYFIWSSWYEKLFLITSLLLSWMHMHKQYITFIIASASQASQPQSTTRPDTHLSHSFVPGRAGTSGPKNKAVLQTTICFVNLAISLFCSVMSLCKIKKEVNYQRSVGSDRTQWVIKEGGLFLKKKSGEGRGLSFFLFFFRPKWSSLVRKCA